MGSIFGKERKQPSRITEHDQAILKLKKQRDQLKQYQKKIEGVLEKDREFAKKLLMQGKKDRAKLLLRKKKYQETLLSRTDGQLENLEHLVNDLEFSQVERQVLDGLKTGNEALKRANELFSVEEIEQIMGDAAEAIEKQKEIDDLIAGRLSEEDEEDVAKELDDLIASTSIESKVEKEPENLLLPDVPSDDLPDQERNRKGKVGPRKKELIPEQAS